MDMFSTGVLRKVVAALPRLSRFFLDKFFPEVQTEVTEEIHFDVEKSRPRLAPLVSPLVAGKVVTGAGYKTGTFKPAYVKDKRRFNPNRPLKRVIGEQIGGALDPMSRLRLLLTNELTDQVAMLTRRQEVMAIEALSTGKITVSGEGYETTVVDFERDAALTVNLTDDAEWGDDGVSPLKNVNEWALLVLKASGATVTDVVFDQKAWDLFAADPQVTKRLDLLRAASNGFVSLGKAPIEGARYMGTIDDYRLWVFAGWYENDSGILTPYLPDHTVIMSGPQLEGVRAFGAIQDEEAGYQAVEYFTKSWVEKDPSVRWLLMQSAPLPVPYRVNASLCATVKQAV